MIPTICIKIRDSAFLQLVNPGSSICTNYIFISFAALFSFSFCRQILIVLLTVGGMNLCQMQMTSVSHVGQMPRIPYSCFIQGIQLLTGNKDLTRKSLG